MSRELTAAVEAAIALQQIRPFRLFFADFTTPWRTWTGYGTLTVLGEEWLGIADALQISPSSEVVDTGSEGLEVVLSGVDPSQISLALQEEVQGKDCEVWFGFMDENGLVIPDPYLEFAGEADVLSHSEDGRTAQLTMTVETAWSDTAPSNVRYSDATQQAMFPGDRFFEFAAAHASAGVTWVIK